MIIQILWINLVTDGLPALALGVEPPEKGVMDQPPRKTNESVMAGGVGISILWQGAMIGALAFGVYILALSWGRTIPEAHTMTFATLALLQLVHSFNVRSNTKSVFQLGVTSNRYMVYAFLGSFTLQAMVLFVPFLQQFFDTVPLRPTDWLVVLLFSFAPLVIVEYVKVVIRNRNKAPHA